MGARRAASVALAFARIGFCTNNPSHTGGYEMSERDEAVKILGQAGYKIRRVGQRRYVVGRECSSAQLVKMASILINGLKNVSGEIPE